MRALSEQLGDLSVRAKKTEDVVAATRTKDRERLERRRAKLTSAIAEGKAKRSRTGGHDGPPRHRDPSRVRVIALK
jgi:hypothetical protein